MKKLFLMILCFYNLAQTAAAERDWPEERIRLEAQLRYNLDCLQNSTLTQEQRVELSLKNKELHQKIAELLRQSLPTIDSYSAQHTSHNVPANSLTPEEQEALAKRLELVENRVNQLQADQAENKKKIDRWQRFPFNLF